MKVLITICGRDGSKGVKNKNFREFLGYPLIDYTIAAAKLFKERNDDLEVDICVNSDSEKLLHIGTKFSEVDAIKRPVELAQDSSPKLPVIKHSTKEMESKYGLNYDYVIDLDITSPLRKVEDIENALQKAKDKKEVDVVYSVVEARRNPYFNMVERKEGKIKQIKETDYVRRQDAPEVYDMNASIYCYRRDSLLNELKVSPFDGKNDIMVMQDTAVLDIDSEEDFELLEILGNYFFKEDFKEIKRKVVLDNN
ncbi:cytidylyltransferase domain-containing protein [Sporohalobacter salinus]|uniref:acylneuraminate cytidylyltransferase family protein n=1 Tax=Sporohalobacter salinus TaxID=1494606 RepID=UPI0019601DC7|nr:acylneuraminate cytidylyltransferase family protein [Sporohalobacter salinus]MBM7622976.1 CMP-N,N'-diacetyllegionaminic acid synthase [Sporohalobacter salinus]